jgi:hypothetical protein
VLTRDATRGLPRHTTQAARFVRGVLRVWHPVRVQRATPVPKRKGALEARFGIPAEWASDGAQYPVGEAIALEVRHGLALESFVLASRSFSFGVIHMQ